MDHQCRGGPSTARCTRHAHVCVMVESILQLDRNWEAMNLWKDQCLLALSLAIHCWCVCRTISSMVRNKKSSSMMQVKKSYVSVQMEECLLLEKVLVAEHYQNWL